MSIVRGSVNTKDTLSGASCTRTDLKIYIANVVGGYMCVPESQILPHQHYVVELIVLDEPRMNDVIASTNQCLNIYRVNGIVCRRRKMVSLLYHKCVSRLQFDSRDGNKSSMEIHTWRMESCVLLRQFYGITNAHLNQFILSCVSNFGICTCGTQLIAREKTKFLTLKSGVMRRECNQPRTKYTQREYGETTKRHQNEAHVAEYLLGTQWIATTLMTNARLMEISKTYTYVIETVITCAVTITHMNWP